LKKVISFLLIGFFLLAAIACRRSSPVAPDPRLAGTWNFISLTAHTQNVTEQTEPGSDGKIVSVADYTTIDNTGTVAFSADVITYQGLSYNAPGIFKVTQYENGQFVDSLYPNYTYYLNTISTSANYRAIHMDSLYFPSGGYVSSVLQNIPPQSLPTGSTYTLQGDTLSIFTIVHTDSTVVSGIVTLRQTHDGTTTMLLKKK
jgi:hypothetical protein